MKDGKAIIVFDSPIGLIALSVDAAQTARRDAESLFGGPTHAYAQLDVTDPVVLLEAHGIAELYGMDETWFLTRARQNRIPHIRMGKYVRFDPTEIRDFFHRNPDRHANSEKTHLRQDTDSKG